MKVISDTIEYVVSTWSDPGDYPNSLADRPQPSFDYVSGLSGELHLALSAVELEELEECLDYESAEFYLTNFIDNVPRIDGAIRKDIPFDAEVVVNHSANEAKFLFLGVPE